MTLEQYKDKLLEIALEKGAEASEVHFGYDSSFSVNIQDAEIEKYEVSSSISVSLRVKYNGHDGLASTQTATDAEMLVEKAIDNAKAVDSDDTHPMQKKCEYKVYEKPDMPICDMTERQRIDFAMELEKKALAKDKRVKRTQACSVSASEGGKVFANTSGLDARKESRFGYTLLGIVMEENGESLNHYVYAFGKKACDADAIVNEAVGHCSRMFGATPVSPGEYRVLFTNEAFADMLDLFMPVFSAYAAQKGLSKLNGKVGQKIASDCFTMTDAPEYYLRPTSFDGEGTPTIHKNVIENGTLTTLLHSLMTARKEGIESTGNATTTGGGAMTNAVIKCGDKSFDELVQGEKVLVINELSGAGTGVNTVSGDFSLNSKGYLYENGKPVHPVNQITVAGNFFEMLKGIIATGNDACEFLSGSVMGLIVTPCVLVDKLMIAG